ncbi:MAG: autotransporter domain-containing protein, partial [Verrucomicrobiota bacterium]
MKRFFVICAALLAGGAMAFGYTNILENGDSRTITNGWDASGDMTIGGTTPSNTLIIAAGGSLTNANAYVGAQAGASDNTVDVSGASAEWINTGTLQVGAAGNSNNSVSVSDGGTVTASNLVVSADNAFNLNTNGTLGIGGAFNAGQSGFNWNDGGNLSVGGDLTGMDELDGTNKTLTLNGGAWDNGTNELVIGLTGLGNSVTVTNSGYVSVGGLTVATGNEFNLNNGGMLAVSGILDANQAGDFNWGDGGSLEISGSLVNMAEISGSNKTLTFVDGGSMDTGTNVFVLGAGLSTDNTVNLYTNSSLVTAEARIGVNEVSKRNKVIVSGAGAQWDNAGSLFVGDIGTHNELTISTSGRVDTVRGVIGSNQSAGNNEVTVGGTNALLNIAGDLFVGENGDNNTLTINANGTVSNQNGFVGYSVDAIGNQVEVSGADALWVNQNNLIIGAEGNSGNEVTVSAGGLVQADTLVIQDGNGFNLDGGGTLRMTGLFDVSTEEVENLQWNAGGNLSVGGALLGITNVTAGRVLTLDGTGATWDLGDADIRVGGDGVSDSTLVSTNGAIVSAANLYAEGSDNAVNVESNAWLLVGDGADESVLTEGGAMVASANSALLVVDDYASVNIAETLQIGASSTETGTVSVANNGTITAGDLDVFDANSAFNLENGGTLVMTGDFDATPGQGFNWKNGGTLTVNQTLTFANDLAGTNKTLNIDGGSWDRGGNLQVNGAGNTLAILNGGGVTNNAGYVIGSNNTVMVSGSGSGWLNNGALNITNSGNSVTVDSGGKVTADSLNITDGNDFNLNSGGTLAMTDGFDVSAQTNLTWDKGGNLSVGGVLSGITNLSDGRVLTLDGTGATWDLADTDIMVGGDGVSGSTLVSTNGAIVSAANLYVEGSGNVVNVGSNTWLLVGDGAATNTLANGGAMVASTNGALLAVDDFASVDIAEILKVGASAMETGTVSVANGGTITAGSLDIFDDNSTFNLDNGGTLAMTGDFDVSDYINLSFTNLNWNDGGKLVILDSDLSGISSLSGSNKAITIEGGTWLNTDPLSIDGFNSQLVVSSNSLVTSVGGSIGTTTNDNGNSVAVRGENAAWQNSGNLYVGQAGSDNSLLIEGGGFVNSTTGYIGFASTASSNTVTVGGSNSQWIVGTDLFVGRSGSNNTLTVEDSGYVSAGNNLFVQNDGALNLATTNDAIYVGNNMIVADSEVKGKGTVQFSTNDVANVLSISGTNSVIGADVVFDAGGGTDTVNVADWEFKVTGNETNQYVGFENLTITNGTLAGGGTLDAFGKIVVSGGWIAPRDEDLVIKGDFEVAGNAILQVTAGEGSLRVADVGLNLTNMSAEVTVLGTNGFDAVILTADGGLDGAFAETNFIEHFLLYDFSLTNDTATTVKVVSEAALDGDIGSAMAYSGIQGIRAGFNGMQNAAFVRTKQMRRNSVATDHAISSEAYLMSDPDTPAGPQGPGDKNTIFGMHFWAEQFSGQGDYDAMGVSDGYTLNNNGTTFGFDKLFGDSLVAGINYTYARSAASMTGGGRMDTETYWLGLYGEWFGKNDFYLEGLVGYGWSDYDTVRREGGYEGIAGFEGSDVGGHVEAGKYLHYGNWAMAPYAGLNYLWIKSDAYTEESENPIDVDGQEAASLEAAVGVKLRNRFDTKAGRFQTAGYVEWTYDFINDEIESSLDNGKFSVETARIAPDESLINAGIGFSWICTDYLEIGVGYDGRFNENYEEHMGSAMLDV